MSFLVKPKVSVIMPTYNVERYFRQCIESVMNQTLEDIEIIPVDDGSPDNCGKIMDQYASKDSRIKPIHKKNGGYGSAVNVGIEKATGEYIAIVETDDWIEPNMYELLYKNAKKFDSDMVKCNFYKYNSKLHEYERNIAWPQIEDCLYKAPNDAFSILDYKQIMLMHASVWAGIYKSEFIKPIKFIESGYYQDFPFFVEVLCKAKRISVVKKELVHYRMEEGQQSSTLIKDERLLNMPRMCSKAKKILERNNLYEELKEELYHHLFLANYGFYMHIDKKYQNKYFLLLKNLFNDILEDKNFKYEYFDRIQKGFIEYIINTPYSVFVINNIYKKIKKMIICKYDYEIYRCIVLFGFIKITTKPTELRIAMLDNRLFLLQETNIRLDEKINHLTHLLYKNTERKRRRR